MAESEKPAEDAEKKPRAPKAAKEAGPKPETAEVQSEPAKVEAPAVAAPAEPKKKTAPKAKKEEATAPAAAPAVNQPCALCKRSASSSPSSAMSPRCRTTAAARPSSGEFKNGVME